MEKKKKNEKVKPYNRRKPKMIFWSLETVPQIGLQHPWRQRL